jgi:hypothetical protein
MLNGLKNIFTKSTSSTPSVKFYCNGESNKSSILWHVNITELLSILNFEEVVQMLNFKERSKITSFYFQQDKSRALLSILLQRAIIQHCFAVKSVEYILGRTLEVHIT